MLANRVLSASRHLPKSLSKVSSNIIVIPEVICLQGKQNPRNLTYFQGQFHDKTREYFYFIDHQGMVRQIIFFVLNIFILVSITFIFYYLFLV